MNDRRDIELFLDHWIVYKHNKKKLKDGEFGSGSYILNGKYYEVVSAVENLISGLKESNND